MKIVSVALSTLLAGLPSVALAQAPASAPAVQTAAVAGKAEADKQKVVCRTIDATGSRLQKRRECHTLAEWTEIRMLDRQALERTQSNRYNGNSGG